MADPREPAVRPGTTCRRAVVAECHQAILSPLTVDTTWRVMTTSSANDSVASGDGWSEVGAW